MKAGSDAEMAYAADVSRIAISRSEVDDVVAGSDSGVRRVLA